MEIIDYLLVVEYAFSKPMDYFIFILFASLVVTMSIASAMLYYRLENFYNSYLTSINKLLIEQDGKQYVSYRVAFASKEYSFEEFVKDIRDGDAPQLPK